MASSLPTPADCCSPCSGTATVQVPGPTGSAGSNGSNGTNGVNAYTLTDGTFVMPAELANVTVTVDDSSWMTSGQVLFVQTAGHMEVQSTPTSTSVILKNLEDAATSAYPDNAAPSTVISNDSSVSPAGLQGPAGTAASGTAPDSSTYLTVENETADLPSSVQLEGLGTGIVAFNDTSNTVSVKPVGVADNDSLEVDDAAGLTNGELCRATADGIESVNAATGRTTLGLGTSAIVDTGVANNEVVTVDAVGGLTNGEVCIATAAGIQTTPATSLLTATYGLLGEVTGVDMTSGPNDNNITVTASRYAVDKIIVENASADVSAAQAGFFTGTGGGGTALANSGPGTLSNLTAGGKQQQLTLTASATTDTFTTSTLYFRVTVGAASGTADCHVYGYIFA